MRERGVYGDGDVLRRRVDQLREQALDVRALADQLVNRTEVLRWQGRAATSMRERVADRAAHLRDVAARHDVAADSLDKHVQDREAAVEAIAEAERKARAAVLDAQGRVERAQAFSADADAAVQADPADLALAQAETPPSGHLDWLTYELPAPPR